MNRIFALTAAAAASALLAGCVPSTYGYGQNRGYDSPYGRPYGAPYPSPYGAGTQFTCGSSDYSIRRCSVDTRAGVRLIRQESREPCIQGRTWGFDRAGVWTSHGCRARFQLGGYAGMPPGYGDGDPYDRDPYDGYDPYDRDRSQVLRCESDGRYRACGLPFRARSVQIGRQFGDRRCELNYSWGWSGDRIWVDRGCAAEFMATY